MSKKQKPKQKNAEPVIFIEGGIVQALLMPSDIEKTGYREQSFELVDYDVFDDHDEENIFFMWSGLSDRLKKYFSKRLRKEKKRFLDRIQQWQDRLDAEEKKDGVGMEINGIATFATQSWKKDAIGKCDDCLEGK